MTKTIEINVRPCGKADLEKVLAVERAVYGDQCYNPYFFRQALDLYPNLFLIATNQAGHVMGYVLGAIGEDVNKGWILSLAVGQFYTKQGVGSLLTDGILKVLKGKSVDEILLTVDPENDIAMNLYERQGFVEIDSEGDYYQPDEKRVVLRLGL